jgi:hypothetical protein
VPLADGVHVFDGGMEPFSVIIVGLRPVRQLRVPRRDRDREDQPEPARVSLSDDIDEAATRGAAAELVALFNNLVKCGVPQAQRRVCEHAVALVGRDVRVHPAVLGEIYEQCIAHPERHAHGVHFTAERELAGVIEPTIVAPWRRRRGGGDG